MPTNLDYTRAGPVDDPLFLSWLIVATLCCYGQSLAYCFPRQYLVMKFQFTTRTILGKSARGCGAVKTHSSMVRTYTVLEALVELGR